jgi:hypothetical protein
LVSNGGSAKDIALTSVGERVMLEGAESSPEHLGTLERRSCATGQWLQPPVCMSNWHALVKNVSMNYAIWFSGPVPGVRPCPLASHAKRMRPFSHRSSGMKGFPPLLRRWINISSGKQPLPPSLTSYKHACRSRVLARIVTSVETPAFLALCRCFNVRWGRKPFRRHGHWSQRGRLRERLFFRMAQAPEKIDLVLNSWQKIHSTIG